MLGKSFPPHRASAAFQPSPKVTRPTSPRLPEGLARVCSLPADSAGLIGKTCQLPEELAGAPLQARVDGLILGREQKSEIGTGHATVHICRLTEPGAWPVLLHVVSDVHVESTGGRHTLTLEIQQQGAKTGDRPIEIRQARWCGLDLRGADLSGVQCYHLEIDQCRLDQANLSGSRWTHCKWAGVSITQSDLKDCRLFYCQFSDIGLHHCELQKSHWDSCTLTRVNWNTSNFNGGSLNSCVLCEWQCLQVASAGASARNCMLIAGCTLPEGFSTPRGLDQRADLIQPGSTVLVPEYTPSYMAGFCDELGRQGIRHIVVRGGEGWLRDVLLKQASTSEGAAYRVVTAPRDPEQLYHGSALQYVHIHHSHFAPGQAPRPTDPVNMEARHLPRVQLRTPDGDALPSVEFDSAQRHFVPGGNLIWTDNDTVLIGNDSIRYEATEGADAVDVDPQQAAKLAQQFPGVEDPQLRRHLKAGRAATKQELKDGLGAKDVIVIPQWAWHIDMGMALVAQRTLVVHSFDRSGDFLHDNAAELQGALGMEKWQELVHASAQLKERFEEQISKACAKLERAGFRVVKACCMLIEDVSPRGVPVGVHSLFSNGLSIQRNSGDGDEERTSYTYLTPGTRSLAVHERHFEKACQTVGAEVRFLVGDDGADPLADINSRQGAVRCMTFTNGVVEYSHFPD